MIHSFVALCFFVVGLAHAQDNQNCPVVPLQKDFNLTELAGRWYVAKSFSTDTQQIGLCETHDFIVDQDGNLTMVQSQLYERYKIGETISLKFQIRTINHSEPARLSLEIVKDKPGYNLSVVDTDHKTYAVMHFCDDSSRQSFQMTWILTRDEEPSSDVVSVAQTFITTTDIDMTYTTITSKTSCFYKPLIIE